MVINGGDRRSGILSHKEFEPAGRIGHPFVRIDFDAGGMRNRDQLQPVYVERLLQFICNSDFVTSIAFLELVVSDANVLIRIGTIVCSRSFPVPHFAAAHEVGYELESTAVPRIQERTGRRLSIELSY